ncbi:MFS transporter [Occultella glacieicola]|uniref:MFS transporter n=1 Tax=Occultella glacieicola TaxID=2518684 RepID=A0ABY2DXH3_9MICO|nr:MFS transporter [Occultella glacieicola]TDE88557.1 MFS transporter [Occultella glacieicola]
MRHTTAAVTILATSFLTEIGARVSALALPLVALQGTGSVAATGLVGGMIGIPMLTSPWWARALRRRIDGGRALALVVLVQALGVLIVPVSMLVGELELWSLAASGLVVGAAAALGGPGQDSLLADFADAISPGGSVRMMATRELTRRITVALGPTLGALGVQFVGAAPLLWLEAAALGTAAVALLLVPYSPMRHEPKSVGRSILAVIRRQPDLVRGLIMRGTLSLLWFSFSLGLVVMGDATGEPGLLLTAANGGYGLGTIVGAGVAVAAVRRLPLYATMLVSFVGLGLCFAGLGAVGTSSYLAVSVVSACGGVFMAFGATATVTELSRGSQGAERRAAFTGQAVVLESTLAVGLIAGGAVIATFGPEATLVTCGLAVAGVSVGTALERRLRHPAVESRSLRQQSPLTTGASCSGPHGAPGAGVLRRARPGSRPR